ncbi:MAG: hypothetical protein R3B96_06050 [Pirellulaceae bacterium]
MANSWQQTPAGYHRLARRARRIFGPGPR